jgi:exopolysaccharide production protein ExoZ
LQASLTDPFKGQSLLSLSPARQNLTSIQSLRGFAALAVCLAHLHSVEAKFGGAPLLGNWAILGFAGVDLFFVISGFVMVWVTRGDQGKASALPGFWLARFLRIYPLWWLVLSAVVAVWMIRPAWVYASHLTDPDILRSYLLFPAKELPLHAVGWTLIHEVWFYLVFGLLLLAPARLLPVLLALWAVIVTSASLAFPSPSDPVLRLIRHPLTLEFVMGAAVGLAASKRWFPSPRVMLQAGCLILLLCLLSIRTAPQAAFEVEWSRVGLFGVPAALIIWGWVGLEQAGDSTAPRWAQALGNWSYGLYLVHVLVFVAAGRLAAPFSREGPLDNLVLLAIALGGAIFAAYVMHILFERPMQKLANKAIRLTKKGALN